MKYTKLTLATLSILLLSGVFAMSAKAVTFPNLPSTPVTLAVEVGPDTYPLQILLSNVPSGFDVSNKLYSGWCFSLLENIVAYQPINLWTLTVTFTDNAKINYILNNQGPETPHDIQAAIWLIQGFTSAQILQYAGFSPSATAIALANDAITNGANFAPGPGEIVAILCVPPGCEQDLLIQLRVPGGPGLTPGFWKHNVGIYLTAAGLLTGDNAVNGAYSTPVGSLYVNKDTMASWLHNWWTDAELLTLYGQLTTMGGGSTGAGIRNSAANVFNAQAGLYLL